MEIHPYLSELVGTAILLLLGNGVVAPLERPVVPPVYC